MVLLLLQLAVPGRFEIGLAECLPHGETSVLLAYSPLAMGLLTVSLIEKCFMPVTVIFLDHPAKSAAHVLACLRDLPKIACTAVLLTQSMVL